MTRTPDELKLDGLAAGLPMEWVHELLGCQWGRAGPTSWQQSPPSRMRSGTATWSFTTHDDEGES